MSGALERRTVRAARSVLPFREGGSVPLGFWNSVWWLRRFEFGPMEWLWRALTYGHAPIMRRVVA